MYGDAVYWFCGCSFFCLIGCFSMIVWTPTVFVCLICTHFLFLYLHLFSTIERFTWKSALEIRSLLLLLLMPIAPGGTWAISDPSPSHSVLGCSCHSGPVGPLLIQLCFSVSPPTVARPASLPLPLRVPGQGLACGAGCWLPEGVSDPAPLPLQYLLGHWFLSHSLPQIFISDLLLPLGFVDEPQTGVEECLDQFMDLLSFLFIT